MVQLGIGVVTVGYIKRFGGWLLAKVFSTHNAIMRFVPRSETRREWSWREIGGPFGANRGKRLIFFEVRKCLTF
jgi:hypothetical protein